MYLISIKPLSINAAYTPGFVKTRVYRQFAEDILKLLPRITINDGPLEALYEFGVSGALCDWDNPIKTFQDVLERGYGFNDRVIWMGCARRIKVPKGQEYIRFQLFDKNELSDLVNRLFS